MNIELPRTDAREGRTIIFKTCLEFGLEVHTLQALVVQDLHTESGTFVVVPGTVPLLLLATFEARKVRLVCP